MGADIIMHSGTKYLDGQGRVMAGALCASQQMITEKFLPVLKSGGMTLAPFNAWVVLKGLETLDIRMRAQSARAHELALWLQDHPAVAHHSTGPSHAPICPHRLAGLVARGKRQHHGRALAELA
jgi:O-succinylhomoserine sulfhydrylase